MSPDHSEEQFRGGKGRAGLVAASWPGSSHVIALPSLIWVPLAREPPVLPVAIYQVTMTGDVPGG